MQNDKNPTVKKVVPTSRRQLTPEQRAVQDALKKVKRLNLKLSKVKKLALLMESVANNNTPVPARQAKQWSAQLLTILNGPNKG